MLQWGPVCIIEFWWPLLVGATSFRLWPGRASQSTTSLPSLASPSQSPTSDLDMQQNATINLYTSLLLCLWNLQPKRSTDMILCYLQGHARIELILILEDASVPQLQWRWSMSSHVVRPWRIYVRGIHDWDGWNLGWKDTGTASRRRRAGVFQGRFRNFKGLAKGLDEDGKRMKRSEQYFQLLMRRHLYICIHLYAFTAMQLHLEWRDNSALLVHSHNKQQYCLEILKFIIVCDSSW